VTGWELSLEYGVWSLGNGHEWEFMANASRAGSDLGQIQSSGCVQGTQYVIMTSLHTKNKQQESRIAGKRWKIAIKTWLYFDFFPAKFGRLESSHNCQLSWQIETWAIWYAPFIWCTPLYTFFLFSEVARNPCGLSLSLGQDLCTNNALLWLSGSLFIDLWAWSGAVSRLRPFINCKTHSLCLQLSGFI